MYDFGEKAEVEYKGKLYTGYYVDCQHGWASIGYVIPPKISYYIPELSDTITVALFQPVVSDDLSEGRAILKIVGLL